MYVPHTCVCVCIFAFFLENFPEQYPAVLDVWADPVATDDAQMQKLRPLLKNTNLETRALKLTYSANRDGWNPDAFHRKVDKLGGGLVVCTTKDGLVCGGCKYISCCTSSLDLWNVCCVMCDVVEAMRMRVGYYCWYH